MKSNYSENPSATCTAFQVLSANSSAVHPTAASAGVQTQMVDFSGRCSYAPSLLQPPRKSPGSSHSHPYIVMLKVKVPALLSLCHCPCYQMLLSSALCIIISAKCSADSSFINSTYQFSVAVIAFMQPDFGLVSYSSFVGTSDSRTLELVQVF